MTFEPGRSETERAIIGLDVMRFLAALLVANFHLSYWAWASPTSMTARMSGSAPQPNTAWAWFGWVGVEIFFVLSGLLIARSANNRSPFAFARARAVRLFPAVWICASISFATRLALDPGEPGALSTDYVRTMFLLPLGPWIDTNYWTLAVEVMFYALVGGMLLINRSVCSPRLFEALALMSAIYWATGIVRPEAITGWYWPLGGLLLMRHGCFFALGGFFWLASTHGLGRWLLLRILATIVPCAIEIWFATHAQQDHPGSGSAIIPMAVWLMAVAAIAAALKWREVGWTARRAAIARTIGLATFPLYLLHVVPGAAVLRLPLTVQMRVPAALVVSGALALAVSVLVEPWMQSVLRKMMDCVADLLRRVLPFAFNVMRPLPTRQHDRRLAFSNPSSDERNLDHDRQPNRARPSRSDSAASHDTSALE